MKTLKEMLFERHRTAEPELDSVRRKVLAALAHSPTRLPPERRAFDLPLLQFIFSLRGHFAGIAAAWLLVLLLNVNSSPTPAARIATEKTSPARQFLAALRQNRLEIMELTESPPIEPLLLQQRRSEVLPAIAIG